MQYTVEKEWEAFGFPCVVVMTRMGHRCGYVGIPQGHRLFKVDYDNALKTNGEYIDVHGGLTFSRSGEDGYPTKNQNPLWWFGYDCAHLCDEGIIRSLEYCITECERLAEQLAS